MTLLDYLHEQYETADGDPVLFRCTECGYRSQSLGSLHAHVEGHRGYTRFGIQLPFTRTAFANGDELMQRTEVVAINETRTVELKEVDGL